MIVCTIIAKNYLAHARVLARSLAEHHGDLRMVTLIIDDLEGYVERSEEPFEVVTPAEIGCRPFNEMAARYSVLELSTAVKPWLLRHLMGHYQAPVTYLDPDIRVYHPLHALNDLAGRRGLVLIPHNDQPIPFDGMHPRQADIMIAGVYNLGYVTVAPEHEIEDLLDWWGERLVRDCRVDPAAGYFVDQRWFDLAPGFVSDLAVVRDPEYNVAYWNLHSRRLDRRDGQYTVDGRPLGFFHFSGFDVDRPLLLSRHQNRINVVGNPALERLLEDYASEVHAQGYEECRGWPYTFNYLPGGTPLTDEMRGLFMDFAHDRPQVPSLFESRGFSEFCQWLTLPDPEGAPDVARALWQVYLRRPDLQRIFPDPAGEEADREGLLKWAQEFGSSEVPLLARVLPASPVAGNTYPAAGVASTSGPGDAFQAGERPTALALPAAPILRPLREAPWGVNVVGYFRSELGVGEAARQVLGALDAHAVPALPVHGRTIPLSRQGHSFASFEPEEAIFPVNLICMNADALPEFAAQAGSRFFAGRYSIGLWFWEVEQFPQRWWDSFRHVEEVWAPTPHVAAALRPHATVPVTAMRLPVEPPPLIPRERRQFGLSEDGYAFLFSYDYLSVFERKNPLAVVDAYTRAFAEDAGTRLVLKCINADHDPHNHGRLRAAVAARPDIQVLDRYLEPSENLSLLAACDAYVSLHRAEGFGLGLAEAMYLGKPVIATGYSGNLDFMREDNSLLVKFHMADIGPGAEPYAAEARWAEPDVDHAAAHMRRLVEDPQFAAALGTRAADDIRRTHSTRAAGDLMRSRLEAIRGLGGTPRPDNWEANEDGRELSSLQPLIARGPSAVERARGRRALRSWSRRGVLRAIRPFTAYQQDVNQGLLEALNTAYQSGRRLNLERAQVTSKLRRIERLPRLAEAQALATDQAKSDATRALVELAALRERLTGAELITDRTMYLALSELARRHAQIGAPLTEVSDLALASHELRVFSQNGEDGVLAEIFRRIGTTNRFFVEFGIEGGREGNCVYLADVVGWSGLFMEADAPSCAKLEAKYRGEERIATVSASVSAKNVNGLFVAAGVPDEPDVLSIDVDGQDYWIWNGLTEFRPRVVVVEYNSELDPNRRLVQEDEPDGSWNGTAYFGASIGALVHLAQSKGYVLVHTELSGVNAFFVRDDLADGRFLAGELTRRWALPNYFQVGYRHPPAQTGGRYLDLDTGKLVDAREVHPAVDDLGNDA